MDYLHKPRRLLITGKSGTGKSEYFIRYVEAVAPRYARVFVFDHEGEFSDRTGWPSSRTIEDLEQDQHIQCFDPIDLYPGDKEIAFEFYCDYVFQYAQSRENSGEQFLFGCDELQKIGGTDILPPDLSCLVETGRRYKVDSVFIAQQCNLIHNRLRNQVTEVISFRHNDKRAIQWLVEYGFDENSIRDLDSGDYVCLTDRGEFRTGNIFSGGTPRTHPEDERGDASETGNSGLDSGDPPEENSGPEDPDSQASVVTDAG